MNNEEKILKVLERHGEMLDRMQGDMSAMKSDIAGLKQGQAKLEQGQAKLEQGQAKLEIDLSRLNGYVVDKIEHGIEPSLAMAHEQLATIEQRTEKLRDIDELRSTVSVLEFAVEKLVKDVDGLMKKSG